MLMWGCCLEDGGVSWQASIQNWREESWHLPKPRGVSVMLEH